MATSVLQGMIPGAMRILIVDDNAAVRKAVRETLKAYEGLEVVESQNGAEAIEQASQFVPDLIVMDISMPGVDGLSAAATIKLSYPEMRILIFTMHKLQELIESARMIGLSGYVAKEDSGTSLLNAVDAVLHNKTYFPILS